MKKNEWEPGCGKPHPAAELISKWAAGQVQVVGVSFELQRPGVKVKQRYPTWSPSHNYSDLSEGEVRAHYIRQYQVKQDGRWVAEIKTAQTSAARDRQAIEASILSCYGEVNVKWLTDWTVSHIQKGVSPENFPAQPKLF